MALIEKGNKGREDGGYTRLFGDAALGALFSRIHGTSISAGTELEKLVQKHAAVMSAAQLGEFLQNQLANGVYLLTKDLIKKHINPIIQAVKEPDFLVIVVVQAKVMVVEMKDGDTFDTKKAQGEVQSAKDFVSKLSAYLLQKNIHYKAAPHLPGQPYTVEYKFCCFNQSDKAKIVAGMKNAITKQQAMTGEEFCNLLKISRTTIVQQRQSDAAKNLSFFVDQMLAIPTVRSEILSRLAQSANKPGTLPTTAPASHHPPPPAA